MYRSNCGEDVTPPDALFNSGDFCKERVLGTRSGSNGNLINLYYYTECTCSRVKFTARRGQLVKPIVKPNLALMCHWLFFQASSSTYPSAKNKVGCQIFMFDVVMSKKIFQYFF